MKINEINFEMAKWQDAEFIDKLLQEFTLLISEFNRIAGRHCLKISDTLPPDVKEEIINYYTKEKYLDKDSQIVDFDEFAIVDKKDWNGSVVLNASYNLREGVVLSKYGAELFYKAYKEFAEGFSVSDRKLNYKLPMEKFLVKNPTQKELLYWCYSNNVSYEKFCRSSVLHEITHRWTMRQTSFDEVSGASAIEGLVELESCRIAEEAGIEYIPIFRHKEKRLAKLITENLDEGEMYPYILTNNIYKIINLSMSKLQGPFNARLKREELLKVMDEVLEPQSEDLEKKSEDNSLESFIDILDCTETVGLEPIHKKLKEFSTPRERAFVL